MQGCAWGVPGAVVLGWNAGNPRKSFEFRRVISCFLLYFTAYRGVARGVIVRFIFFEAWALIAQVSGGR